MSSTPLPPPAEDGLPPGWPSDYGFATLAWDILPWAETMLAQPDGDDAGDGWAWTLPQARIVAWWYAVRPQTDDTPGRFLYRRGQIVLPKGAGKTPLIAALSCCSLLGPVVFDGFDSYGEAVGRPHASPHVQLCAVSQSQTSNTYSLVLSMLSNGEVSRTPGIGMDIGLTRVLLRRGKLEPVSASATSREGQRVTDAFLDEPHLWLDSNGGTALANTIRRNLGKTSGRSLETTNCWLPGQNSVAQRTYEYGLDLLKGDIRSGGLLRYHPQPTTVDLANEGEVRAGLDHLYRWSPWVDQERLFEEIMDSGTSAADAFRFYLNQITSAADAWIAHYEWDACDATNPNGARDVEPVVLGDVITLGFDGSRQRTRDVTDATALVACRVSDGHIWPIQVWEQPQGPAGEGWEAPRHEVQAAIEQAFEQYKVVGFYADPAKWETYIAGWEAAYGRKLKVKASRSHPVEWWMTGGRNTATVRILDQFLSAILHRELSHAGHPVLTEHALNAYAMETQAGVQVRKEHPSSRRKIDALIAAVLAFAARTDALATANLPGSGQIIRVR